MQQQLNVDISQTSGVTCEKCGGTYFQNGLVIRKASGLLTGTGKTTYIPIPVFCCRACGHVNAEFLPQELTKLDQIHLRRTAVNDIWWLVIRRVMERLDTEQELIQQKLRPSGLFFLYLKTIYIKEKLRLLKNVAYEKSKKIIYGF